MPKRQRHKITKRIVDALEPGQAVWDTEIIGFGVRRQVSRRTYVLKTTLNRQQKYMSIGTHGSPWTVETARREAIRLLTDVRRGIDPTLPTIIIGTPTVSELCHRYLTEYAINKKPRSEYSDRRLIHNHIMPLLGSKLILGISKPDIESFRDAVRSGKTAPRDPKAVQRSQRGGLPVRGGTGVANRCLTLLSKMFNLAEDWGLKPQNSNPVRRVKKYREFKKERFLSHDELARLGKVLKDAEQHRTNPFAIAAVRLLIFTGARLNEILTLRRDWVHLDRRIIVLPDSKTGRKCIRLSEPAIEILRSLPSVENNPFVICGREIGAHIINLQKTWARLRSVAGIMDVRLHDLRHTFASVAMESGHSLEVVGSILGHKTIQTTSRYAHFRQDHVSNANDQVGQRLSDLLWGQHSVPY